MKEMVYDSFVCCVCGKGWQIYDRELGKYFCDIHTDEDLPQQNMNSESGN